METDLKSVVRASVLIVCLGALGFFAATQAIAHIFNYQPALGRSLSLGGVPLYWPWSWLNWDRAWGAQYPGPFALARVIALAGAALALLSAALWLRRKREMRPFGTRAWADFADVEAAGLFAKSGAILGKFDGEILAFDGPEHQLVIGASRSGKGRGHVVPTLLSWGGSALVLDVKGELDHGDPRYGFPGVSGYRAELGPVLRFAPTHAHSNCFNPLFEVRKGENEVRDVQNIAEIIVGPSADQRGPEAFWNASAKIVITGVILHVLYAEPAGRKTLAVVREKLRDLDRSAEEMRATLHRLNPTTKCPEVHAEVLHAALSYLAGEERLRSGIKATAESFFGIFADPIVAEKTARSDFRVGDLMCAEKPVTLFLQPPPSDAQRLMPLMRLFIVQAARALMEDQTRDAEGREKRHRLILMLDEFPQLGRLDFFEKMMGAMAGYGLKAYLVCQSLNHITRAYGRDNVILDNCHVVTAFAASDPDTAKRIADMAGEVWEIRPHESEQRPRALFGPRKGLITYREERRPLMLPADVRGLKRSEQLIFVAGMKPLKAKKLRFDAEAIFAHRLRPPAALAQKPLCDTHDWTNVVPLGRLPRDKKPVSAMGAQHGARPNARPQAPPPAPVALPRPAPPLAPQPDLFPAPEDEERNARPAPPEPQAPPSPASVSAPAPPQSAKISDRALAGFRDDEGAPLPHPGVHPLLPPPDAAPPRRARTPGV
ncbi:MAG: conjugal transfer protein TraG [Alphaproteobacteria bacterium]|nr:MAG: conjugal transfer protein TraG [Alphaproteobacteria bacterium]